MSLEMCTRTSRYDKMHIYNIFTFNLLKVQERQPNIFGRGAHDRMLAWYG